MQNHQLIRHTASRASSRTFRLPGAQLLPGQGLHVRFTEANLQKAKARLEEQLAALDARVKPRKDAHLLGQRLLVGHREL